MVDAREMKKILRNNGYEYQRCKGSHFMYSNGVYTVAVNKDLNAMVAKRIIKQCKCQHTFVQKVENFFVQLPVLCFSLLSL